MKKILTSLLILILPIVGLAGKNFTQTRLSSFVSEFKYEPGVEFVKLGIVPTMIIKGIIRANVDDDPEDQMMLKAINGVRKLSVFEFEDAPAEVRNRIVRRLDRILASSELLMEVKDDDDQMKMYGIVDNASGAIQDFVMYSPSDCALICIFGTISMDAVANLAAYND